VSTSTAEFGKRSKTQIDHALENPDDVLITPSACNYLTTDRGDCNYNSQLGRDTI